MQSEVSFFSSILKKVTAQEHTITRITQIAGGDINDSFKVVTNTANFFIKINDPSVGDLFEKEHSGMKVLQQVKSIHVPNVIGTGTNSGTPFLVLEFIEKGKPDENFWEIFGNQLAALHQHTQKHFGLDHNNYIGKLPQKNTLTSSWVDFFIQHRLEPQLKMAQSKNLIDAPFINTVRKLYTVLPDIFPLEKPALLHGDLWSGNFMNNSQGLPCIFDPAVYYGHREMELAFTHLFGGFDQQFYDSYHEAFPLAPGFEDRIDIYNIYPLMVHVNLFGPSYLSGIQRTLNRFL